MTNEFTLLEKPFWGFETANCRYREPSYNYKLANTIKILGYFPVTGTCIAILRSIGFAIALSKGEFKGECLRAFSYTIRTGIEFTGLAFLTLPLVDLIVQIDRSCSTMKPQQTPTIIVDHRR